MPQTIPLHRPSGSRLPVLRPPETRGTSTQRGYSWRWGKFRRWVLSDRPLCECAEHCHQAATDVDHVLPVSGRDDPTFWEEWAVSALAHGCHSRKTGRDKTRNLTAQQWATVIERLKARWAEWQKRREAGDWPQDLPTPIEILEDVTQGLG
jgi:5-methylcytosine-specific restriction protein A